MAPPSLAVRFGRNLARLREAKGFTQEQLAESIDVHEKFVQKIELGQRTPSLRTLVLLQGALQANWNDLMCEVK